MENHKINIKRLVQGILLVAVSVLIGVGIRSCMAAQTADQFVVLSTSDMNGNVWESDVQTGEPTPNNMLAASSLIKDIRNNFDDRTITYDNGDLYQGSLIQSFDLEERRGDIVKDIEPETICMDEIKYDGFTLGNHEFNYKYTLLQSNYEYFKNTTSLVSANIYDKQTGNRIFDPYFTKTFKVDGEFLKVGIIGLENPDCSLWDASSHFDTVQFYAPDNPTADLSVEIKKVQHEMEIADEKCDFVIVSMHNGFYFEDEMQNASFTRSTNQMLDERASEPLVFGENTEAQAYRAIKNTTGIDMFICGHDKNDNYSNMTFKNADESKDVLVVNGASESVTRSVFKAKADKSTGLFEIRLVESDNLKIANYSSDEVLKKRVSPYVVDNIERYANGSGKIVGEWTLNENDIDYYIEQTDYADLINRAQMWAGTTWAKTYAKSIDDINKKLRDENGSNTKFQLSGDIITPDLSLTAIPSDNSDKKIRNGNFVYDDAKRIYPDDHYLCSVAITGAEIKEMLEWNAQYKYYVENDNGSKKLTVNGDLRSLPVFYGINFTIDMNERVGNRVKIDGFSNGKSFDLDGIYCAMVNSYIIESNATLIYENIGWNRVIIEQDLNHNGTYIRHILDLYAKQNTTDFGGIYSTKDAKKDGEKPSIWYIKY